MNRPQFGPTLSCSPASAAFFLAFLWIGMAGLPSFLAAQPPGADLSGRYEFVADFGGRSMDGVIELMHAPDSESAGQLRLGSLPPAAVTTVLLIGSTLTLGLQLPEGPGQAVLTFSDDTAFTGEIWVGSNLIAISGEKTRSGPPPRITSFLGHVSGELDRIVPQALAAAGEVGLAVALADDGSIWSRGFGRMDRDRPDPVTPSTLFQVGSISKLLTAWGVMRLVERGQVELDEPVNAYLEGWRVPTGEFDPDGVTVRRLLSHTAGINVPSLSGVDLDAELPGLVDDLNRRDPDGNPGIRITTEPGTAFMYSGGGYMVLQLLIEEVTGESFAEYMRKEVLEPLGMNRSTFGWSPDVARSVATPHSDDPERDGRHRLFTGLAGAGLYTSAEDFSRLLAAHFVGQAGEPVGRGVLDPSTLASMMVPDSVAATYGLGYEIYRLPGGGYAAGHSGSNVGWKANLIIVPELNLGAAVVTNADQGIARNAVVELIRDAVARLLDAPATP